MDNLTGHRRIAWVALLAAFCGPTVIAWAQDSITLESRFIDGTAPLVEVRVLSHTEELTIGASFAIDYDPDALEYVPAIFTDGVIYLSRRGDYWVQNPFTELTTIDPGYFGYEAMILPFIPPSIPAGNSRIYTLYFRPKQYGQIPIRLRRNDPQTGHPLVVPPEFYDIDYVTIPSSAGVLTHEITVPPPPPDPPAILEQFRPDGSTPIPQGGGFHGSGFVAAATLDISYPGSVPLRLQVEVRETGTPFSESDAQAIHESAPVDLGQVASVAITGLPAGRSFRWRARSVDLYGQPSGWTCRGSNPDDIGEADFILAANPPPDPATPRQFRRSTGDPLIEGGAIPGTDGILLQAVVSDPDQDPVALEVEVGPLGIPFMNLANQRSPLAVSGGTVALELAPGPGSYRWQFRTIDGQGAATAWTSFGSNAGDAADFIITQAGSTGPRSCVQSSAGPGIGGWILALPLVAGWRRRGR